MTDTHLASDPQCACVSDDARECMRRRYPITSRFLDDESEHDRDDERCECGCHEFDEDDLDDVF